MSSRLVLVSRYAHDLARLQEFYTDLLGMEVVPQFTGPDFAFLRSAGGTPIALRAASSLPPGTPAAPGATKLSFDVDDLDATYADWKAKGVEIGGEIADVGAGRVFLARDPEGHTIGVSQLYDGVREYRRQLGLA
jgi:predicted enzyme related to lactoylglutathione lyase